DDALVGLLRETRAMVVVATHPRVVWGNRDVQVLVGRNPHPVTRGAGDAAEQPADAPRRGEQLVDLVECVPAVAHALDPAVSRRIGERAVRPAPGEQLAGRRETAEAADVGAQAHAQHPADLPAHAGASPPDRWMTRIRPRLW